MSGVNDTVSAFRDMCCLLGATAALWLVHLYGRVLSDLAVALVVAVLALVMGGGTYLRARIRRRAFLCAYVQPGSGLQRWWRGGGLLLALHLVVALLPATVLVTGMVRLAPLPQAWWLAGLAVPLVAAGWHGIGRALGAHVSGLYRPEACWRLLLPPCFVLLLAAFTMLALQQSWPDFTGVSLERALWHLVDGESAQSGWLLVLLELAAAKDALWLWFGQQLMPVLERPGLQLAGWALMLAAQAVFVWAWLMWLSGVMVLVHHGKHGYPSLDT